MKSFIFILSTILLFPSACVAVDMASSAATTQAEQAALMLKLVPLWRATCAVGSVGTTVLALNSAYGLACDTTKRIKNPPQSVAEVREDAVVIGEGVFTTGLYTYVAYRLARTALGI